MSRTTEECGCKHDGTRWLSMCDAHTVELKKLRAEWHADYLRTTRPAQPKGAEGLT